MPPPRQIQDSGEIENRRPLSGRDALAALRAQVEGVTAEQRERHVLNLREYLDRTSATPEQRRQALDGLSRDFHTVLDIQSAQSRSVDNAYRLGKTFLETTNRNPERGNIRFHVIFENEIHNATIGLGHILPPNVRRVAVTDLRGNVRIGERQASPRVGYFDGQGYIPVFNGYMVDVLTTVADNDQQVVESRNEERNYFQNLLRLQQQEARATLSADVESTRVTGIPPQRTETLSESPQYRDIIRKFTQAEISLPEETLIYAERDLRDLREHINLAQMLDPATLEIFKLASFGGRIGTTEIQPPTHEGYDIRFKDIPLFHQFANRLRDPIFSRTILSILEREKREREADFCTFENVYELIENAYVAQELVSQETIATNAPERTVTRRPRTEYEIGANLLGTRTQRFLQWTNNELGISMTTEDILREKPATPSDFQGWYRNLHGPANEFDHFYRAFRAIAQQESNNRYDALGDPCSGDRALGKYQIMTRMNWRNWSREAFGRTVAPTAMNQDRIAFTHMVGIYKKWRRNNTLERAADLTAATWYGRVEEYRRGKMTGPEYSDSGKVFPSTPGYVLSIRRRMQRMAQRENRG